MWHLVTVGVGILTWLRVRTRQRLCDKQPSLQRCGSQSPSSLLVSFFKKISLSVFKPPSGPRSHLPTHFQHSYVQTSAPPSIVCACWSDQSALYTTRRNPPPQFFLHVESVSKAFTYTCIYNTNGAKTAGKPAPLTHTVSEYGVLECVPLPYLVV